MTIALQHQSFCPSCFRPTSETSIRPLDACCQRCSLVLAWFRERLGGTVNLDSSRVQLSSSFADLSIDSFAMVEMIMDLEDRFDVTISSEVATDASSVGDVVRFVSVHRIDNSPGQPR